MNKNPSSHYLIRFGDCDLFGHLNNARYLDYFLDAREDHIKESYQLSLADFYRNGVSWLVGGHQITYLRPANYDEKVMIASSVIQADPEQLLVEMTMADYEQSHLKALLWTRFIPVNVKSGKRQNHSDDFMDFLKTIKLDDADVAGGYELRLKNLMKGFRKEVKAG